MSGIKGLTEKRKKFADFYIKTGNATKSYLDAGYKVNEKTAAANASRLLTNDKVKAYIDKVIEKKDKKRIASQDEVLEFYTKLLRGEEKDISIDMIGKEHKNTPAIRERVKAADALARRYGLDKPANNDSANMLNKLDTIIEEMKNAADS